MPEHRCLRRASSHAHHQCQTSVSSSLLSRPLRQSYLSTAFAICSRRVLVCRSRRVLRAHACSVLPAPRSSRGASMETHCRLQAFGICQSMDVQLGSEGRHAQAGSTTVPSARDRATGRQRHVECWHMAMPVARRPTSHVCLVWTQDCVMPRARYLSFRSIHTTVFGSLYVSRIESAEPRARSRVCRGRAGRRVVAHAVTRYIAAPY